MSPTKTILSAGLILGGMLVAEPLEFRPAPTVITGTLKPFELVIDGKKFPKLSGKITGIAVNGTALRPKKDPHRSFFFEIVADHLEIALTRSNDEAEGLPTIHLPRLEAAQMNGAKAEFFVSKNVTEAYFDRRKAVIEDGKAAAPMPVPGRRPRNYLLELRTTDRLASRQYGIVVPERDRIIASTTPTPAAPEAQTVWERFSLGTIVAIQTSGDRTYSAEAAWIPRVLVDDSLALTFLAGGSVLKRITGGVFPMVEISTLLSLELAPSAWLGIGGGAQTWHQWGGLQPIARAQLEVALPPSWEWVRYLLFGYGYRFASLRSHQIHAGVGFEF